MALVIAKVILGQDDHANKPRGGGLNINNIKIEGKIISWIVLELIVGIKNLRYKHVGLSINKTTAVLCTKRGAAKHSAKAVNGGHLKQSNFKYMTLVLL